MWQQLRCNYYVQFILGIICDTVSILKSEPINAEELEARKSNLENAATTLQTLLLIYKESKQIPSNYVLLFAPLIELKEFIKKTDLQLKIDKKNDICNELLMYKEKIESIHQNILKDQTTG